MAEPTAVADHDLIRVQLPGCRVFYLTRAMARRLRIDLGPAITAAAWNLPVVPVPKEGATP